MKTTKIYLILIMILLMSSCVLATTTITDIKIEGLQYINATDNICVSNPNLCLINAIMSSWINITYDYELDNGTIIRSWNTTFVTDNAYNTEGELTALLDDNYIAIGTKLGNTSTEVADMLSNTTIVRASNTSWVTDLVTGADNESFNQSHTDTLYQASGSYYNQSQIDNTTIVRSYNTSWITDNQLTYTSDNTTWTQLVADGLYADISVTGDNTTWNQLVANNLYADISVVDTTIGNCSSAYSCDVVVYSDNTSWITDNQLTYTSDNATWNQLVANGLYADISVSGDNTSWSQLVAEGLFPQTSWTNLTFDAEADGKYVQTSYSNVTYEDELVTYITTSNSTWITENQNNLYNTSSEIFDAVNNTELHTTLHCFNDACTHYINDTCHVYPSGGKSCTGS